MIPFVTFFFIAILLGIFFQDMKERKVSLFLFIIAMILGALLYFQKETQIVFILNIGINLGIVLSIFGIIWAYTQLKLKQKISTAFGLGDLLFFCVLAVSMPIVSFLVVFVFSLLFSLIVFTTLKNSLKEKTVPLAGLQALFFACILGINNSTRFIDLYAI